MSGQRSLLLLLFCSGSRSNILAATVYPVLDDGNNRVYFEVMCVAVSVTILDIMFCLGRSSSISSGPPLPSTAPSFRLSRSIPLSRDQYHPYGWNASPHTHPIHNPTHNHTICNGAQRQVLLMCLEGTKGSRWGYKCWFVTNLRISLHDLAVGVVEY